MVFFFADMVPSHVLTSSTKFLRNFPLDATMSVLSGTVYT